MSSRKSTVEAELYDSPPNFHHLLIDQSVKLGESKILTVTNTTMPEPTVEWFRNDYRIDSNDHKYILKHDKGLVGDNA